MMKRFIALIAAVFLLMVPLNAYADLIVVPDNEFYKNHQGQFVYLGRSFCANSAVGSVSIKDGPDTKKDIAKLENGETIFIEYSCLYNGEYWGFTFDYYGWVRIDQLLVFYDYVAFGEDHLVEFYTYEGNYDEIKKTSAVLAWPWPGADAPLWTIEDLDTTYFRVSPAYRDEQGREWGFVSYLYGSQNIWVCLSDPLNRDIPVFNPEPAPMTWVSDTEHVDIGKTDNSTVGLIIILVAALAAGTAVLIKVFWRLGENKPERRGHD